jgi:hypothetical protein
MRKRICNTQIADYRARHIFRTVAKSAQSRKENRGSCAAAPLATVDMRGTEDVHAAAVLAKNRHHQSYLL